MGINAAGGHIVRNFGWRQESPPVTNFANSSQYNDIINNNFPW